MFPQLLFATFSILATFFKVQLWLPQKESGKSICNNFCVFQWSFGICNQICHRSKTEGLVHFLLLFSSFFICFCNLSTEPCQFCGKVVKKMARFAYIILILVLVHCYCPLPSYFINIEGVWVAAASCAHTTIYVTVPPLLYCFH